VIGELALAIPIAAACVAISAFCSGIEVAVFSIRRIDREQLSPKRFADRRVISIRPRPASTRSTSIAPTTRTARTTIPTSVRSHPLRTV